MERQLKLSQMNGKKFVFDRLVDVGRRVNQALCEPLIPHPASYFAIPCMTFSITLCPRLQLWYVWQHRHKWAKINHI